MTRVFKLRAIVADSSLHLRMILNICMIHKEGRVSITILSVFSLPDENRLSGARDIKILYQRLQSR